MELTAEVVSNIIRDCLPNDDVLTPEQRDKLRSGGTIDGYIAVLGAVSGFCFVQAKIDKNRANIETLLRELPDAFMKTKGGGWSFLNACMTRDDQQWGEQRNVDELICLGIAIGAVSFTLPRQMWSVLPGGMPYICVDVKDNIEKYRDMQRRLLDIRRQHNGTESPEEDTLLEELDTVWYMMTEDEHKKLLSDRPIRDIGTL